MYCGGEGGDKIADYGDTVAAADDDNFAGADTEAGRKQALASLSSAKLALQGALSKTKVRG